MLIRPGEGDDIVRTEGSATIQDIEEGDEITLTFRDGTEMISINYGDATGAGNPLVIRLEGVRDVASLQIDVFQV